jgi:hypothetical protein
MKENERLFSKDNEDGVYQFGNFAEDEHHDPEAGRSYAP